MGSICTPLRLHNKAKRVVFGETSYLAYNSAMRLTPRIPTALFFTGLIDNLF